MISRHMSAYSVFKWLIQVSTLCDPWVVTTHFWNNEIEAIWIDLFGERDVSLFSEKIVMLALCLSFHPSRRNHTVKHMRMTSSSRWSMVMCLIEWGGRLPPRGDSASVDNTGSAQFVTTGLCIILYHVSMPWNGNWKIYEFHGLERVWNGSEKNKESF
jgi:hypothetical protein